MIIIILLFVIGFFVLIRFVERYSIYYPMVEMQVTPKSVDLFYEDITFETNDRLKLNGWYVPSIRSSGDEPLRVLLFFHGNAGNISHRIEKVLFFSEMGLDVFIIDYRGYGKSEGSPSENGLKKDAVAAYQYLYSKRQVPSESLILYGESIGGAVACDLAGKVAARALILEDTFTSIPDMVKSIYPFLP